MSKIELQLIENENENHNLKQKNEELMNEILSYKQTK